MIHRFLLLSRNLILLFSHFYGVNLFKIHFETGSFSEPAQYFLLQYIQNRYSRTQPEKLTENEKFNVVYLPMIDQHSIVKTWNSIFFP